MFSNTTHQHLHHHQSIKEEQEEYTMATTASNGHQFKSDYVDNNNSHGWDQQQTSPESFALSPSPIYEPFSHYEEEETTNNILATYNNNNRVHLRHFSANDSHCIRGNNNIASYLASPSSSTFILQQQNTHHHTNNASLNHIPQQLRTIPDLQVRVPPPSAPAHITEFDKQKIQQQLQRRLRFEIILEAATAVTQKAEESAITYLNRGQVYGIQLNDKQGSNEVITSTLSIAFHSSSHRRIAESYWKFWVSQQKQPEARAIDIDTSQSTGITDLKFPSFDKITFNWNGRFGAKIYVRFKCLSTDFSRIKGVKGIPLRAQMESHIASSTPLSVAADETCFCKVKLFRDKGAERKNKDDAKQISKQLEKVYGKANEQSLPLMYNVSLPYSVFGEIPTSSTMDSFEHAADDSNPSSYSSQIKTPARHHTRVMTAPTSLFYQNNSNSSSSNKKSNGRSRKSTFSSSALPPYSPMLTHTTENGAVYSRSPLTLGSAFASTPSNSNFSSNTPPIAKENYDFQRYLSQQQQALASPPSIDTNHLRLKRSSPPASCNSLLGFGQHHMSAAATTHFEDDLPPLTADTTLLHTPGTAQATPTDYSHQGAAAAAAFAADNRKLFLNNSTILTPDLMMDCHQIYHSSASPPQQNSVHVLTSSIYDVFTPEEIQHQSCSITPTPTREEFFGAASAGSVSPDAVVANLSPPEFDTTTTPQTRPAALSQQQRDYFCSNIGSTSTSQHISLLQQQLQLHNKNASNIMLNNSSMLLLSPPPPSSIAKGTKRVKKTSNGAARKKKRHDTAVVEELKTEKAPESDTSAATTTTSDRVLSFSSNPSHVTLSTTTITTASAAVSSDSSISSHCSVTCDSAITPATSAAVITSSL